MSDTIGRITVPTPTVSGLTFPLTGDYPATLTRPWPIIEHRFGEEATLAVQRFAVGFGPRRFQFVRTQSLSITDRANLLSFWNSVQGSYQSFYYNAPNPDGTTTAYSVVFDVTPLSFTDLANRSSTGITFVEIVNPSAAPSYSVSSTCVRFPSSALATALLSQTQQLIPLIHIQVRDSAVPEVYLSDRRVTVNGQVYLPRVLDIGEPGSSVLLTQDISGKADNVQFTLGNADRAMSQFIQDTTLKYASIDLSLYHVQTGILWQLWKGIIISFQSDGSANFRVQCSDGLFPITQNYPRRTISRYCWKTFNDGIHCPYSTYSESAAFGNYNPPGTPPPDPASCDFGFNTSNGCLAHGMSPYFGGQPEFPQSVVITDDGTGTLFGIGRNTVTSTSIISDSIWDNPLPEIWCNDFGNPLNAFWANTLVAAVRDESTFEDVLGIVGAGPIGGYEGMSIQVNADGYKYIVAPLADGVPPQGFKVNSNLVITGDHPGLGLREVNGNDPAYTARGTCTITGNDVYTATGDNFAGMGVGSIFVTQNAGYLQVAAVISDTHIQVLGPNNNGGLSFSSVIEAWATFGLTELLSFFAGAPTRGNYSAEPWAYCPEAFSLGNGTPQVYTIPDPAFSDVLFTGASDTILPFSAGTAFCEVRYSKSAGSGISPTTAESHSLSVPISQGLTGVRFDQSGNPTSVPGMTNPFWVAVNTYFRALGIDGASTAAQLAAIVLPSIFAGDGTGCAEIADLTTFTPLITGYTGPQFMFQGTITEFKPFRDWLTQILNCANGYFTFEFGALRLGMRYSAVSSSSFTLGNMLYQSLSIQPGPANFEYLKIDFADVQYQYQLNFAEYQDKDYSTYMGRSGAPLTSRRRDVGLSTLDQALRVCTQRVREEIGGILRPDQPDPYIEWNNNLIATWKSTVLSLGVGIGDVVSLTHPDIPTYPGPPPGVTGAIGWSLTANTWNYRVTRIAINKDWSVTLTAKSVTDSMYALDVGPQTTDAAIVPLPQLFYPQPVGPQWAPHQVLSAAAITSSNDALFPDEYNFDLLQSYLPTGGSDPAAVLTITGVQPVNQFIPGCGAPNILAGKITQSATGGWLTGGLTYRIAVSATNAAGQTSPPSAILIVQVPSGTNTNTITLSGIQWPNFAGLTGYVVYASPVDDLIGSQQTGALTASGSTYTPTSITLGLVSNFNRSNFALPDPITVKVRVKAKNLIHGGVEGAAVTSVSTNVIVATECIDVAGTDNWTGRVVSIIGRNASNAPFVSFLCTAFNPSTGQFTFSTDPSAAGVQVGDALVVCTLGASNSSNQYVFTDAGLSNAQDLPTPHAGLVVNDPNLLAKVVRVIRGTSRGLKGNIVSNTATSITLDTAIPIDSTSVWIVEDSTWIYQSELPVTSAIANTPFSISLSVNNSLSGSLLVAAFTVDSNGNESSDGDGPSRMLFVWGAGLEESVIG